MHNRMTHVYLTESPMYTFNRITGTHLTESNMYVFNRITHVCI